MTQLAVVSNTPTDADEIAIMEEVVVGGNLERLTPLQRLRYYDSVCRSMNLNPKTKPFEYVNLRGAGLKLYPTKNCADQLRKNHRISISILSQVERDGIFTVTARATMPDGRTDEDCGSVAVKGLSGEALANATMKAITKSKRRVTLSICGLSGPDDSEVDSIPGAQRVDVDHTTGEIIEQQQQPAPATPYAAETVREMVQDAREEHEALRLEVQRYLALLDERNLRAEHFSAVQSPATRKLLHFAEENGRPATSAPLAKLTLGNLRTLRDELKPVIEQILGDEVTADDDEETLFDGDETAAAGETSLPAQALGH